MMPARRHRPRTRLVEQWRRARSRRDDSGLTLVELLVAFATMLILFVIVASAVTAYLSVSTKVISSYQTRDQIVPATLVIQRLFRSEVEPAPSPTSASQVTTGSGTANQCPTLNAPCPPFVLGTPTGTSVQFYANLGTLTVGGTAYPGPALVTMTASAPTKCSGCAFYTSTFTATEQPPNAGTCPTSVTSTAHCVYGTVAATTLVYVPSVVNGQTNLLNPSTPILTYNTKDPFAGTITNGATSFSTCGAPTTRVINSLTVPVASNCPADDIQSVQVDLQVLVSGVRPETYQEDSFVVYRLTSTSFLYSPYLG